MTPLVGGDLENLVVLTLWPEPHARNGVANRARDSGERRARRTPNGRILLKRANLTVAIRAGEVRRVVAHGTLEAVMVDYLIAGAVLVLAVLVLARQALRIRRGGGCGCEGGGSSCAAPRRVRRRSADASRYPHSLELRVAGMHCEGCVRRVEDALGALDGVAAEAKLPDAVVVRGSRPIDAAACERALRAAGYEVVEVRS